MCMTLEHLQYSFTCLHRYDLYVYILAWLGCCLIRNGSRERKKSLYFMFQYSHNTKMKVKFAQRTLFCSWSFNSAHLKVGQEHTSVSPGRLNTWSSSQRRSTSTMLESTWTRDFRKESTLVKYSVMNIWHKKKTTLVSSTGKLLYYLIV